MKILFYSVISLLVICISPTVQAELEPLLFSGQPGIMIDANGNGSIDANDGMVAAMFDPDTNIILFQVDQELGGGIVIFQIDSQFGTNVLEEIAQFPPTGQAEFVSSRAADQFTTIFLDTVSFTPANIAINGLLQQLLGGSK